MTVEAITQSKTHIQPAYVSLNALNPSKLADFYQSAIGLTLIYIDEVTNTYTLGTPDKEVLLVIHPATSAKVKRTTGLYHTAFLLPSRADLGAILRHLLESGVGVEGASDHDYSEALYLNDPEGNGIEIYRDRPREDWDVKDNGMIMGVTEALDAEGVLAAQVAPFSGVPVGTTVGHVHLHVGSIEGVLGFYYEVMGLGLKALMGDSALFMSTQDYHHHLGANIWNGRDIDPARPGAQGLNEVVWQASQEDITLIQEQLKANDYPYSSTEGELSFNDPAGITHRFIAKKG